MKKIMIALVLLTMPVRGATWTVINTADAGAGSLRQAILDANADGDTSELITFAIPGAGPYIITLTSADLPSLTHANTTVDGTTQQVSPGVPAVFVDGAGAFTTFIISANNCIIDTVGVFGSSANGIRIESSNNIVRGCFVGTNTTGTAVAPSPNIFDGVNVVTTGAGDVTGNIIGGPLFPNNRNLLSGNSNASGVSLAGGGGFFVTNTTIQNNYIGTNVAGTAAVANSIGIGLGGVTDTAIMTNLISGNSNIGVFEGATNDTGTTIAGNKIGTDVTGLIAVPNSGGGILTNSPLTVGGATVADRNIISGNGGAAGIQFNPGSDNSLIRNNYIGVGIDGITPVPNIAFGIFVIASGITIQENVVSGNGVDGIILPGANNTVIIGNKIGVDATGTRTVPNVASGIHVTQATGIIIGGATAALANIIGGNVQYGINFESGVTNSIINGNFIGTNSAGTILGNRLDGIRIAGSTGVASFNNLVENNTIRFNGLAGVEVVGDGLLGSILNPILENSIYDNNSSGIVLTNNGNHNQEPPVVVSATLGNNSITITATAPATPAASNFRLEFFTNQKNRLPITEGQTFVGAIESVPSGATVTQTFMVVLNGNPYVSATATNLNNVGGTPGDTSPFSGAVLANPISCISQAIVDKYCPV